MLEGGITSSAFHWYSFMTNNGHKPNYFVSFQLMRLADRLCRCYPRFRCIKTKNSTLPCNCFPKSHGFHASEVEIWQNSMKHERSTEKLYVITDVHKRKVICVTEGLEYINYLRNLQIWHDSWSVSWTEKSNIKSKTTSSCRGRRRKEPRCVWRTMMIPGECRETRTIVGYKAF